MRARPAYRALYQLCISIDILSAKCLTLVDYASVFIATGLLNFVLGEIALGVRKIRAGK